MMSTQRGFTLLETVIAIALTVLIGGVLFNTVGPWLTFQQRMTTDQILTDLQQATTTFYRANMWDLVNVPRSGPAPNKFVTANGALHVAVTNGTPPRIESLCPSATGIGGFDPSLIQPQMDNLKPLEPYLSMPLSKVSADGFNNIICVLVSPRSMKMYQGVPLFYHTVAFIATGENMRIDDNTQFTYDPIRGWVLTLDGDDRGMTVDGFQPALENYQLTLNRLQRFARAYESYFQIRYYTKSTRDMSINYFYYSNGNNNGDTGNIDPATNQRIPEVMLPMTKEITGLWGADDAFSKVNEPLTDPVLPQPPNQFNTVLGISATDSVSAWGRPIYIDNSSPRVKSGVTVAGTKGQPPFSAAFSTYVPGTNTTAESSCSSTPGDAAAICPTFITVTATGLY